MTSRGAWRRCGASRGEERDANNKWMDTYHPQHACQIALDWLLLDMGDIMTQDLLTEKPGVYMRFQHSDGAVTTISHPDADMDWERFVQQLRSFAVACGYHADHIKEVFGL